MDAKETWDLTPLFKSDDDPAIEVRKKEVADAAKYFSQKWKKRDDFLSDAKVLRQALDEYEALQRRCGCEGGVVFYFHMRSEQEQDNAALRAKYGQALEFARKMDNGLRFFPLRLGKIPLDMQKKMLADKELEKYRHFLERIFAQAKYTLSEAEENILSLKADVAYTNWIRMVEGFLSREERNVLDENGVARRKNFSEIDALLKSTNKATRDSAGKAFEEILLKHLDVAEHELNAVLQNKKIDDELRKLERPDASRHLGDDLDSSVVDALVATVSSQFSLVQRYYRLKARLLGVPTFAYYERNVPYISGASEKKYPYPEAAALVRKVFAGLDAEFASVFERYLRNRQIDAFPRKGKRAGAFCADDLLTLPTFVLLNHTDTLRDVTVIAHEMGHAINSELMKKQHALNFGTILSTAEVASTFMESFVVQEIEKEADDALLLELLMARLQDDMTTIFRQIACYRFEQELHAAFRTQGYLSKETLGSLFSHHMASYLGAFAAGSENWWVHWRHIREYFYNYSYASGLLISKTMQAHVRKDKNFIVKVKEFLSAGMSASPHEIFLKMGMDIADKNFWNQGLESVETMLGQAETLAKKLGKI